MTVRVTRGTTDSAVDAIAKCLESYQADHPSAEVEVYRQNQVSIRVRVIDPAFNTMSRSERSKLVWPILHRLSEEILSEISFVVLISPEEKQSSMSSREFDDPIPSQF